MDEWMDGWLDSTQKVAEQKLIQMANTPLTADEAYGKRYTRRNMEFLHLLGMYICSSCSKRSVETKWLWGCEGYQAAMCGKR